MALLLPLLARARRPHRRAHGRSSSATRSSSGSSPRRSAPSRPPTTCELLESPITWKVIETTLAIGVPVAICSVARWLRHRLLHRLRPGRGRQLLFVLTVTALMASYLVRVYAWRTLLGSKGIVNGGLEAASVSSTSRSTSSSSRGRRSSSPRCRCSCRSRRSPSSRRCRASRQTCARPPATWARAASRRFGASRCRCPGPAILATTALIFFLAAGDYLTPVFLRRSRLRDRWGGSSRTPSARRRTTAGALPSRWSCSSGSCSSTSCCASSCAARASCPSAGRLSGCGAGRSRSPGWPSSDDGPHGLPVRAPRGRHALRVQLGAHLDVAVPGLVAAVVRKLFVGPRCSGEPSSPASRSPSSRRSLATLIGTVAAFVFTRLYDRLTASTQALARLPVMLPGLFIGVGFVALMIVADFSPGDPGHHGRARRGGHPVGHPRRQLPPADLRHRAGGRGARPRRRAAPDAAARHAAHHRPGRRGRRAAGLRLVLRRDAHHHLHARHRRPPCRSTSWASCAAWSTPRATRWPWSSCSSPGWPSGWRPSSCAGAAG